MEHLYPSDHNSNAGAFVANVRKIAVLRANALGDFLFTLPALSALRTAYPQAEIVLLAKAWHKSFLQDRPSPIDRVIEIPPFGGVGEMPEIIEDATEIALFFHNMAAERFDLAIQMHGGGGYSNRFIQRLKARMSVGLQAHDAVPLTRSLPYLYFQHEVLRYLELVGLVGATTSAIEPRVTLIPQDLTEAATLVPPDEQPLVVLHPGASDPRRRWPTNYFAAVGDALHESGARIAITGSGEEYGLVSNVIANMQSPALNLSGKLSLGGLAGLLSRCHVVVSNDTGPLHLAAAVGTPTVGLFWCGNFINAAPLTRARHRPLISWRLTCPACGTHCLQSRCVHQQSFIADITIEEVITEALQLMHLSPLSSCQPAD